MNTDNFLHKDLSYKLRGLFFQIRNTYGPGQKENVYINLLEEALKENKIPFNKEKSIKIYSPNKKLVGLYKPDFIVDDKIIIEVKSSRFTTRTDEKQLYYYLRNSQYEVGFLVNFSTPYLYIKRIIYTNDNKPFLQAT
jgi:GxxExxY protein